MQCIGHDSGNQGGQSVHNMRLETKNSLYCQSYPGMLCSQETTVFQLNEKVQRLFQEADCVGLFADHQHMWEALGERGLKGDLFRLGLDSSVG